jgi:hypothetical protein
VNIIPSYIPGAIPQYPSVIPQYPGVPQGPNRPPIEVEDPADNLPADQQNGSNNKNENDDDDDTVTIESL